MQCTSFPKTYAEIWNRRRYGKFHQKSLSTSINGGQMFHELQEKITDNDQQKIAELKSLLITCQRSSNNLLLG